LLQNVTVLLVPCFKHLFLPRPGIIYALIAEEMNMEAERLNSLEALLADLGTRTNELRGYL
jgi:hypothetical protein